MRDRPSGSELARLAAEIGGEPELMARCRAIAKREAQGKGEGDFAVLRAELSERYGMSDNVTLLARLVSEIRDGVFDAPSDGHAWLMQVLRLLTRAKLRESNPDLLSESAID